MTSSTKQARVLIIAGSDSGGGAGIQGDLKTVHALGGYGMTAITALTAQNTLGVFGIHPVPDDFIAQQIDLCLSDIGADAIKTGMLHSASVIETIVNSLPQRGRVGVGASTAQHSNPALDFPRGNTLTHARALRSNATDAEKKLWNRLRHEQLGARFRRQHPLGAYIADFACLNAQLILEIDGGQHADVETQKYDQQRTAFFMAQGFRVLRFWNHDVMQNEDGVLEAIQAALGQASPHPNPPPQGEGIIPLVVDPVMVAKGGSPLLAREALEALKTKLIPRAAIITPNLPEAELLLGRRIDTSGEDTPDMVRAAQELLSLGAQSVLLKGGHSDTETLTDILITADTPPVRFITRRIDTRHTHGTGCTFASAIATGLAQQLSLSEAVRRAHRYVQQAIARAPGLGAGNGPLGH